MYGVHQLRIFIYLKSSMINFVSHQNDQNFKII